MGKTFFVSDPHFNHSNIINLARRPFPDVFEMNHALVRNWNAEVRNKDDIVYCLGDFAWSNPGEFFHQLNGKKILIVGNHDPSETRELPWESVQVDAHLRINGRSLHLYHYPLEDWNHKFRGGLHLHGHTHGGLKTKMKNRIDCGVENMLYRPWEASELIRRIDEEAKLI